MQVSTYKKNLGIDLQKNIWKPKPLSLWHCMTLTCLSHLGQVNVKSSMALLDLQYIEKIDSCIHERNIHRKLKCHTLFLPFELYIMFVNEEGTKFEDGSTLERENGVVMEYCVKGNVGGLGYGKYEVGVCMECCCV